MTEVKELKRLLTITGTILIAYVVFSAVAAPPGEEAAVKQELSTVGESVPIYLITEENDRVVVYRNDEIYLRTDTQVSSLPKGDRQKMERGITVFSDKELKEMIEDYCS